MKKNITLFTLLFVSFIFQAQTTFTFNGSGNWTDEMQWMDNNYPGTTIGADDLVLIEGDLIIPNDVIVTNNGELESLSTAGGEVPSITILGRLVNNNIAFFSRTQVVINSEGGIVTNGASLLTVADNSSIINDGSITIFDGTIEVVSSVSSIINNNSLSNRGVINIFSGTFENKQDPTNPNLVVVNNTGVINATRGEIINRGDFRNNNTGVVTINRTFTNEATAIINNGGVINVSGFGSSIINSGNINNVKDIIIEDFATINSTTNSIFISQGEGNILVSENGNITNNASQFTIRDGVFTNNGTIQNNTTISTGFLQSTLTGELINNGSIINGAGAMVNNFGFFSGINSEHSGDFTNSASFSPGNALDSTGFYKIDSFFSSYIQDTNGSLNIDLGGTIAGDNYDQLVVDRNVTLAGTLNVNFVDGFNPAIGDSFVIIDPVRSISGTFENVNLPALEAGKKWSDVGYDNSTGVVISIVEDATLSVNTNLLKNKNITVYPNPTHNEVYIVGANSLKKLEIYNAVGQLVRTIKPALYKNTASIDMSSLKEGVYFLKSEKQVVKIVKK